MKLLIHDFTPAEWDAVRDRYAGWDIVTDDGSLRPCMSCFGCWTKNPGECVIRDGYACMGARMHAAEEVVVESRCTWGGVSAPVKNLFDRSIGWVLPFFEVVNGEMHHRRRYPEAKPISFHYRGEGLSDAERAQGRRYAEAMCRNFRGKIREVTFRECPPLPAPEPPALPEAAPIDLPVLLNCSIRGKQSHTEFFLDHLAEGLPACERMRLAPMIGQYDALAAQLRGAKTIVLGMPLYVDGVPSAAMRLMEALSRIAPGGQKRIYVVANMGLYESRQLVNLLTIVRNWCAQTGYVYCGGAAIGAGPMIGMMDRGPAKNAMDALKALARAVSAGTPTADLYADPFCFPRGLYIAVANASWPITAWRNGLTVRSLLQQR